MKSRKKCLRRSTGPTSNSVARWKGRILELNLVLRGKSILKPVSRKSRNFPMYSIKTQEPLVRILCRL